MRRFSDLCQSIELAALSSDKAHAIAAWWPVTADEDRAWGIYLLLGGRLKRRLPNRELKDALTALVGVIPEVVDALLTETGDFAGTLASLLPPELPEHSAPSLYEIMGADTSDLNSASWAVRQARLQALWTTLSRRDSYLLNRLLTGTFKLPISRQLVLKTLSRVTGVSLRVLTQNWRAGWVPEQGLALLLQESGTAELDGAERVVFHPIEAHFLDQFVPKGNLQDWMAEWWWDGPRVRLSIVQGEGRLCSAERSDLAEIFPEVMDSARTLAGEDSLVLEGKLVVWRGDFPAEKSELDVRLKMSSPKPSALSRWPVSLVCDDVLEWRGCHRDRSLIQRRSVLESLWPSPAMGGLRLSERLTLGRWESLWRAIRQSEINGARGVLLKTLSNAYGKGDPWLGLSSRAYRINTVLIAAERGEGRRAGLYTEYTLALWDQEDLVPVTKVSLGLTPAEIKQVDQFVRSHTIKKHGAKRFLSHELVFEVLFDDVERSLESEAGWSMRGARIHQILGMVGVHSAGRVEELEQIDEARARLAFQMSNG